MTGSRRDPRYYPPRPPSDEHPGMANYPSDPGADGGYRRSRRSTPSANRWLPPLDEPARPYTSEPPPPSVGAGAGQKVTVTRAAAQRSREMGSKMYGLVHRAATADGADKSGLTALTWPVVANFAVDAAMAVALANTLFFAAASGESKGKVALYLLITIAPFAVIAPLIGPALDRLQHGRRVALAMSFILRTALVVVLIFNYDGATGSYPSWVLYPCALGMMVLSKSFSVLRSAVTPRVLPPTIDLVRVNSRLTTFGLLGGTMVGGAIAAGAEWAFDLFHMPGALYVIVAVSIAGAALSMRIPKWVEVTAGEVPATLSYHGRSGELRRHPEQHNDDRISAATIGPQHHCCALGELHGQGDGRVPVPLPSVRGQVTRRQRLGAAAHPRRYRRGGGDRQLRGQFHRRAAEARLSGTAGCAVHDRGHLRRIGDRADRQVDGGRDRHVDNGRGGGDREGIAGRVAAGRSAGEVARVGVRTLRVVAAVGLGGRRRHGRVGVHRSVGGLHGDLRGADPRTGTDGGQLLRRVADTRLRRQPSGARRAGGRQAGYGGGGPE